jgi:hypothetical protein
MPDMIISLLVAAVVCFGGGYLVSYLINRAH